MLEQKTGESPRSGLVRRKKKGELDKKNFRHERRKGTKVKNIWLPRRGERIAGSSWCKGDSAWAKKWKKGINMIGQKSGGK